MRWMLFIGLVGIAYLASACQSAPPLQPTVEGRFDVGGVSMYLQCLDAPPAPDGTPTVLLEHGIGLQATSETWLAVQQQVAPFARVCRYDRAGVGKSDPPLQAHRTGTEVVTELHQLLAAAHVTGPYVLVGHSFGGYPVRLYAHQYPKEVVGMVLVDTAHEDMIGQIPLQPESLDATAIGNEVRAAGTLGTLPLVVIARGKDLNPRWDAFQQRLLGLSSQSSYMVATQSDHQIPINQPEIVVSAIKQLVIVKPLVTISQN
jgi:pimeloyl-ACP methyl ester carboxylesterase